MQAGINIEDVKKYNASLREYKEKSAKLRAEIDFSKAELARQCKELSAELGFEVTPDNVKDILEERVKKIQNTMSVGTEILKRIKMEEARGGSQPVGQVQGMPDQSTIINNEQPQQMAPPTIPVEQPRMNWAPGVEAPGELPTTLPNIFGNSIK